MEIKQFMKGYPKTHYNYLFCICFLEPNGPIKFKSLDDLWFKKGSLNPLELKVVLLVIESLILRIKGKSIDFQKKEISLIKDFLNVLDYEKFEIFKYLQSNYSYYADDNYLIILSLLNTLTFDNKYIKKQIKGDFKNIMEKKCTLEDNIAYDNIIVFHGIIIHQII